MNGMEKVMIANSHIYPGAAGAYELSGPLDPGGREVMVEFNDGVRADGRLSALPGPRRRLEVSQYTTTKGALIPPKVWILQNTGPDQTGFLVREHGEPATVSRIAGRRRLGRG